MRLYILLIPLGLIFVAADLLSPVIEPPGPTYNLLVLGLSLIVLGAAKFLAKAAVVPHPE